MHYPPSRSPFGTEPKKTGGERAGEDLNAILEHVHLYAVVNQESQENQRVCRTAFTYMVITHML